MTEKANNQRLIVVSDSVIAVAVTLLVLDVRLPVEDAGSLTDAALWLAILATLPRIYAYLLSFVVVALWVADFVQTRSDYEQLFSRPLGVTAIVMTMGAVGYGIMLFVLTLLPGTPGTNEFGPDPKAPSVDVF